MAEPTYHNFDLFFQREGENYRVRADSDEGQAGNTFALPFSEMELENFLLTTRPGRGVRRIDAPDVAAAKKFGGNLFEAVFGGDVQGCWRTSSSAASQEGSRLRVRLRFIDTPELADLPWEYLFSKSLNRFLALDDELAIVRYLDMPERTRPVAVTLPLRVLVMISNPADFPRLDVEQEWAHMQEALAPLQERGLVQIDLLEDATLPALRKKLQASQYHILHFIGHGAFDRQTQEGVVVLKDENERGRLVSGQHLGWLLHNFRTLALVIINACEGARADRTDAFAGTAQSLVQQGIPAAVAMQFEITDGAAKTFSHAFYTAVADARPVENALFEARMAIFAEGHELEWATPVLYMRAGNGHLFDITPGATLSKPEQVAPAAMEKVEEPVAEVEPPTRQVPAAAAGPSGEEVEAARVAALYSQAQEAARAGNMEEAATKAKEVLAADPWHAEAAGLLRYALEQQDLARLYGEGQAHLQAGRWAEAITALSQVRDRAPGYKDVDTLIATAQARQAEADSALSRGDTASMAAAQDAMAATRTMDVNKALVTAAPPPTPPTAKSGRASGGGGLPMAARIGVGAALVAAVLLVVFVAVIAPRLTGSNSATPTQTPESSAIFDPSVSGAATDTPEPSSGAESTPDGSATEEPAAVPTIAGTIKIGVDLPLSGVQGSFGTQILNGVQMAIEDVNYSGGVNIGGDYFTLDVYALDDAASEVPDPAQGLKNVNQMIAEPNVVAIVGPFNSSVAAAEMPVLNEAGMAQIGVGTGNEELTKPEYGQTKNLRPTDKITFFRLTPTNDIQGAAMAYYMINIKGKMEEYLTGAHSGKVYVLDDAQDYGKNLADSFEKEYKSLGGEVAGHDSVPAGTTDFKDVFAKVAEANPDLVFFGGSTSSNLALARKQMKDAGLDIPFVGGDGIVDTQFTSQAGDAGNGSYGTVLGPTSSELETAKDFTAAYESRFNESPGFFSAQGYDAAGIIISAVGRAGSRDREAVRAAIADTKEYQGVLGTTGFDANGDTTYRWISIYGVEDKQWKYVDQFTFDK